VGYLISFLFNADRDPTSHDQIRLRCVTQPRCRTGHSPRPFSSCQSASPNTSDRSSQPAPDRQQFDQKCIDDFSAKSLICLKPTLDSAQVGLLTEKAPLAWVAAIWAGATRRNASYSCHVLARYDGKIPVRHLILFKFFEISWLAGMCTIAVASLYY
jgi:hypothetical protein